MASICDVMYRYLFPTTEFLKLVDLYCFLSMCVQAKRLCIAIATFWNTSTWHHLLSWGVKLAAGALHVIVIRIGATAWRKQRHRQRQRRRRRRQQQQQQQQPRRPRWSQRHWHHHHHHCERKPIKKRKRNGECQVMLRWRHRSITWSWRSPCSSIIISYLL